MMGSGQTLCIISLAHRLDFCDLHFNFQGQHLLKAVKISSVCTLSPLEVATYYSVENK